MSALLFDHERLRAHKRRAERSFEQAAFLHKRSAVDLLERLEAIQRPFSRVLALGAPDVLRAAAPGWFATREETRFVDVLAGPHGEAVNPDWPTVEEGRFDAVIAPLFLHWANDLPGALMRLRRALRPDGILLASLFGPETLIEARDVLLTAESEARHGAALRIAPFAELRALGDLVARAGFAMPAADREVVQVHYRSFVHLAADLRAMGETNAMLGAAPPLTRGILRRAEQIYRERYSVDGGRLRASFEVITIAGWAPAPDQPQPLKPGSARMSLAEALKPKPPESGP